MKIKILSLLVIRSNLLRHLLGAISILAFAACVSFGQTSPATSASSPAFPSPTPTASPATAIKPIAKSSLERDFLKNILKDQAGIWTSPFRLQKNDLKWFIPLTAGTTTLLATDRKTAGALSNNRSRINFSLNVSQFGSVYATGGTALSFYAIGKITGNRRAQETGLLAGEALINSTIVIQVLKRVTERPRPLRRNGSGTFFTGGDSFPSGHSAGAWTLAAVISDEYGKRHPFIRYAAYGLATAVSLSRYTARRHFLGDILVGGAIGYGIGHYTFRRHHDISLDAANNIKTTTKLEKYFPAIVPQYDARRKIYGADLIWNL